MAKTKPTENPIIPFVQEIGKDLGIIVQNTQTIVERLSGTTANAEATTPPPAMKNREDTESPLLANILRELEFGRKAQQKLNQMQEARGSTIEALVRLEGNHALPDIEVYRIRVNTNGEHEDFTIPLPERVIGKTGYYRWYDASDEEWHMSSATFFGETLVMGNPLGESSFDIEFLLVNRVEFMPDEVIQV